MILEEVERLIPKNHSAIKTRHVVSLESQKIKVIEEVCEIWKAIHGLYNLQIELCNVESISHKESFCEVYSSSIEGTIPSEIADAVIALMTYCGEAGICRIKSMPATALASPSWFLKLIENATTDFNPHMLMSSLISLAERYGVDLIRHIHLKMRFNSYRRDWE